MYNIEVEEAHTFYAEGVLVHNCAVCGVKHLSITMEIPRIHTHSNCRCWKVPITLDPHRPMVNFQANPVSWVDFLQSIGKR